MKFSIATGGWVPLAPIAPLAPLVPGASGTSGASGQVGRVGQVGQVGPVGYRPRFPTHSKFHQFRNHNLGKLPCGEAPSTERKFLQPLAHNFGKQALELGQVFVPTSPSRCFLDLYVLASSPYKYMSCCQYSVLQGPIKNGHRIVYKEHTTVPQKAS